LPETVTPPADPPKPLTAADYRAKAAAKAKELEAKPATVVEPPKPETPPEPKPAAAMADALRREKQLVERQKRFQDEKAQLAKEREAFAAEQKAAKERDARLRASATEALKAYGHTYEAASREYLSGAPADAPKPSAEASELRAELEAFRAEQKKQAEAQAQAEKERQAKEVQQSREEWLGEINDFLSANAKDYVLTRRRGQVGLVAAVIQEDWKAKKAAGKNEAPMEYKAAADLVEKHLRTLKAQEDEELKALEPAPVPAPQKGRAAAPVAKERTSLTSDLTSETGREFTKKPMTPLDYRRRALAKAREILPVEDD
jgi:hypothetical protein